MSLNHQNLFQSSRALAKVSNILNASSPSKGFGESLAAQQRDDPHQLGSSSARQFLRSMIPYHASAILMCNEAAIQDAEIRTLCGAIASSQQAEIEQMQTKLRALGN